MNLNFIGIKTIAKRECIKFLRTSIQSLCGPWLNALLYIFIFGKVIGSRVTFFNGQYSYLEFVFPGVLTLNIIIGAYRQASFSLYLQRFTRGIEEALIAPLSSLDIILGYLLGGLLRSLTIGLGTYLIAVAFGISRVVHIWDFLIYSALIALIFSYAGLLFGLWSESWEQLGIFDIFVITPLTFLGGLFTSLDMIAPRFHWLVKINPFFYFIDAIRYSMIGVQESSRWTCFIVILSTLVIVSIWTGQLFSRGYKIKP
ncbi:MAG: Inner membrane transport permease YadH [Chlamydiae bacterium]|nr:Inner membrane transport permease YadH [Chlamydiota bacterium]